jgi:hypothetical protein
MYGGEIANFMSSKKQSKLQEKINLYLTIVVLALFIIVPPILCGLFYLSQVPDVTFGDENGLAYTRIWMYKERRPLGIGYQNQRVIKEYTNTEVCVETRLRFLLWGNSRLVKPNTTSRVMILAGNHWQSNGEKCR